MRYELTDDTITCIEDGRAKPEAVYWLRAERGLPGCGPYWALDYRRADGGVGTVRTFAERSLASDHMLQLLARLNVATVASLDEAAPWPDTAWSDTSAELR
jgi:hypothetical protein